MIFYNNMIILPLIVAAQKERYTWPPFPRTKPEHIWMWTFPFSALSVVAALVAHFVVPQIISIWVPSWFLIAACVYNWVMLFWCFRQGNSRSGEINKLYKRVRPLTYYCFSYESGKKYKSGKMLRWMITDKRGRSVYCYECGNIANGAIFADGLILNRKMPVCWSHIQEYLKKHPEASFDEKTLVLTHPKIRS